MMMRLILLALLCGGASAVSVSHSLRYFSSWMSPMPGLPEFVLVGYVDEQEFVHYDSDRKKMIPRQRWIAEREGKDYWDGQTQILRDEEPVGKADIQTMMGRTNQTGGIHTVQLMYGCELREDGTTGGFMQFGWDGRDLISFDKDSQVWVTPVSWGQITKNKWDNTPGLNQQRKGYLEGICIEWLKKYLEYGKEQLRPVKPSVTLTPVRENKDLSCIATGFYPQAIEVNLFRGGVRIDDSESTGIRPNHDGSYQIRKWMEFDPNSQAKYSCEVEHSGLGQKLVVFYEPKSSSIILIIIGIVVALLLIVAVIAGVVWYKKKAGQKADYKPAKSSDRGESSSNSSANA
ncbi:H-2 class I histocompatibility antigen, Q9 alpha chain-like [Hemiscyllium ocellatum]|uniref:H-2 class I histocompatibility antigen, Q9 alpha chain-like n=1 Tax=Hemiscyllium ocellatum TaxID=170820 RepID=UPI002966910E|nr:H-2 class I histocompatibility antigen, Q9 alpha chain-like [Hemiscyllium ocellatum]